MKHLFYITLFSSSLLAFDAYQYNSDPSICFHNIRTNGEVITTTYVQYGEVKTLEAHSSWYEANTQEAYYYNSQCNVNAYDSSSFNSSDSNTTNDWETLGLEESQYHFLMGLTANLLGFTLVFLVGFLFVLQGRR